MPKKRFPPSGHNSRRITDFFTHTKPNVSNVAKPEVKLESEIKSGKPRKKVVKVKSPQTIKIKTEPRPEANLITETIILSDNEEIIVNQSITQKQTQVLVNMPKVTKSNKIKRTNSRVLRHHLEELQCENKEKRELVSTVISHQVQNHSVTVQEASFSSEILKESSNNMIDQGLSPCKTRKYSHSDHPEIKGLNRSSKSLQFDCNNLKQEPLSQNTPNEEQDSKEDISLAFDEKYINKDADCEDTLKQTASKTIKNEMVTGQIFVNEKVLNSAGISDETIADETVNEETIEEFTTATSTPSEITRTLNSAYDTRYVPPETLKLEEDAEKFFDKLETHGNVSINNYVTSKFVDVSFSDLDSSTADQVFNSPEILKYFAYIYTKIIAQPNLKRLISLEDQLVLDKFLQLPGDYQYICLKLYTRQAKWYQIEKLLESIKLKLNTNEQNQIFRDLNAVGFITTEYGNESLDDLLSILQSADLKTLCKKLKIRILNSGKPKMTEDILTWCRTQSTLTQAKNSEQVVKDLIADILGPCIKMEHEFWMFLFRIQFIYYFADPTITTSFELYQRIMAVITEKMVLPTYTLDTDFEVFSSPEEFKSYSDAAALNFEYLEATEKKNGLSFKLASLAYAKLKEIDKTKSHLYRFNKEPRFLRRFSAFHVYSKILSSACKEFTRDHQAVTHWLNFLLENNETSPRRGAWYTQLCIYSGPDIAARAEILFKSFHDASVSEADRYDLYKRAEKLFKNKKVQKEVPQKLLDILKELFEEYHLLKHIENDFPHITIEAQQIRTKERIHGKAKYFYNNGMCTVEEVAEIYYHDHGYKRSEHCEGRLIVTIFILVFWDLVYNFYVPGAFVSPVQFVPLDLFSKDFYTNRKQEVDVRLNNIEEKWDMTDLYRIIDWNIEQYAHVKSLHTVEYVCDKSIVLESVSCMKMPVLAKILRRLVEDFRCRMSGMPDLFVWNVATRKCLFVEVKSQNDKLSTKQILWLNFLHSIGAKTQVCHVKSIPL